MKRLLFLLCLLATAPISRAQNNTDAPPPGFFGDTENDNLPVRIQPAPNNGKGNSNTDGNRQHDGAPEPDPETMRTYIRVGALCKDGSRSYSVNSGTCSGHGGVAFWLYGPPGTPADAPLERLVQIAPGQKRRGNYRAIPLEQPYGIPYQQQAMIESDQLYGWLYKSRHPAAVFVDILIIVLAFLQVGWFIRKAIERYKSNQP
ncbi:DUF3761 domain-containing protein [Rhodoflexus sp.]